MTMKCASLEISLIFRDSIVKKTMNSCSVNETSSLASPQQMQGKSASMSCNCFHQVSKATAKLQIPGEQFFLQGSSCLWQWLCLHPFVKSYCNADVPPSGTPSSIKKK